MKYFSDMNTKYGFNDGESVPNEAWEIRKIYCTVLNALLEKNKSKCRIVPFNRSGVHNPCMWIRIEKNSFDFLKENNDPNQLYDNPNQFRNAIEAEKDPAWDLSVKQAMELGLDDLININIETNENLLQETLLNISK